MVGNGSSNFSERLLFNGAPIDTNAFTTGWDTKTYPNPTSPGLVLSPGASSATIGIDHLSSQFDCLNGGTFVLSTNVQDVDEDGLIDAIEDSSVDSSQKPWATPDNQLLPDIHAMKAGSDKKDIFIEVGAMRADPEYCVWRRALQHRAIERCRHRRSLAPAEARRVEDGR